MDGLPRTSACSLQASPGMTITIFSINCDMMKKARARLGSHGAACNFHDHETAGIARHVRVRLADASA
jgi:arsenate reductase-like glutaredoxin family protein